MAAVGALYDRYTRGLLDRFTGEQLRAQLNASAGRLAAFLEARTYQLETLARYPAASGPPMQVELLSLMRLEADEADLYGILIFSEAGDLVQIVPGQAASGPPYWSGSGFDIAGLPRRAVGEAELVGPVPPRDGRSGWFLIQEPLRGGGRIALHVRLASLTEMLGGTSVAGVIEPVLRTPAGDFNAVGHAAASTGQLLQGPEIAPGWRPCLRVEPDDILRPFRTARYTLFAAPIVMLGAVAFLTARMARRLKRRVDVVVHGAEMIATGDFTYRLSDSGRDEIGLFAVAFNRMAEKLHQVVERTVHMERLAALGQFSTGVAHEVRNPLATLKTTVQAFERVEHDPERLALLADMEREIDRMSRTLGDMLAYGRPRPPERARLRLREIVRRLESLVLPEARQRKIRFAVQGDVDLEVLADPDHLLQILTNLVLNALQATPPEGLVTLRCFADDGRVSLEVRDSGKGIAPENLRKVFEPFFTTKRDGTGLGLSISRQLAELNGGSLDLESQADHGTTVRVLLTSGKDTDA